MAGSIQKYYGSFLKFINRYLWSESALNNRSGFIRYAFAFSLVLLVTYFKLAYYGTIGNQAPFLLYFGVIIICTGFGGIGPGIFATTLSTFATIYFFLYPYGKLALNHIQVVQATVFISECLILIALSSAVTTSGRKLKRSSKRFKALIEKSKDGIIVANRKGRIMYASPATRKILGYSPGELKLLKIAENFDQDEFISLRDGVKKIIANEEQVITLIHRFYPKKGDWIWIESTVSNLLNEPAVRGIVINFRNITERVILEKQKDDFVSIATHELKTPVTSLKAYAQLLLKRFKREGNEIAVSMISKMDGQLNKLVNLIGDLLDITKIESGKLQMHEGFYSFNDLVKEVVEELQRISEHHHIVLDLDSEIQIYGDRERVGQVLTNLISNAVKYSPKAREIFVISKTGTDTVTVRVRDFGIGISAENQANVFEQFYRVSGPENQSFPGLGLGLFISKEIILRQGGCIWVESEKDKGSDFCFSLSNDFRKPLSSLPVPQITNESEKA
jgi:PAS domain S-box-containing protein